MPILGIARVIFLLLIPYKTCLIYLNSDEFQDFLKMSWHVYNVDKHIVYSKLIISEVKNTNNDNSFGKYYKNLEYVPRENCEE
jgi:hypothetical protein